MTPMINVNGDTVSVGNFYVAMYWGFVVSTSLVGISLVQGYFYFTRNNNDRYSMKAIVGSLLILDPATSILMAQTICYYFVTNFGDVEALERVPVSWTIENGFTVLVTAIVQIFFASRVYLVNNTLHTLPFGRIAPTLVLLFALAAFVTGTLRTTLIGVWAAPVFSRDLFQTCIIIEESSALVSDLLASICLCYMMTAPRLGSLKRSETLKTLFLFIVNRAILMSLVQIGFLVSYLAAEDFLYWMPFHLCKSKLYTNTLLAILNSRPGCHSQSEAASRAGPWSLPTINLTIKDGGGIIENNVSTSETVYSNKSVGAESSLPSIAAPDSS